MFIPSEFLKGLLVFGVPTGGGGGGGAAIKYAVQQNAYIFSQDTGTDGTNYVATLDPVPLALTDGQWIVLHAAHTNSDVAPTLDVNGLGAKSIVVRNNQPLPIGSIVANRDMIFMYDLSLDKWVLLNDQTEYVPLGGGTMTGLLTLSGDPVSNLQATTKQYVDAIASGFEFHNSCVAATTANLNATYNNGTAGVGATLTNAGALAAFSADGVAAIVGSRYLVWKQTTPAQNGIYVVTVVGDGATPWVLTRATDYDNVGVGGIQPGDFIPIDAGGATYGLTSFLETATVTTIGTDPIVFAQFTENPAVLIANIQNSAYWYSTDTGATNAYVATLTPAPAAYVTGLEVYLKVSNTNTGASTINVNGLGVKNIKLDNGSDPSSGDLLLDTIAILVYDGTNFQLKNPVSALGATSGITISSLLLMGG